jgi:hypothetical protein
MEFTATPEAVPPTLTIFVQNTVVNLDELKIPEGNAAWLRRKSFRPLTFWRRVEVVSLLGTAWAVA